MGTANCTDSSSGLDAGSEEDLIRARRVKADISPEGRPWALAFSGGGIRSATFCLGLSRALARNGLLARFDYLSTVSGGGYIGSAIGRLFSEKANAARVSQGIANDRSLFLWWLRCNGRFLLPAGFGDALQAAASYLRGALATHIEVGVLALLLSCVVILPHLVMLQSEPMLALGTALGNPWWIFLPFITFAGLALLFSYWIARDDTKQWIGDLTWCSVLFGLSMLLYWCALEKADRGPGYWTLIIFAAVLLSAPIGGIGYALYRFGSICLHALRSRLLDRELAPAHIRLRLTVWLSRAIAVSALILIVGVMDLLTWMAASKLTWFTANLYASGVGLTAGLVLVLRVGMPKIQKYLAEPGQEGRLTQFLNALGLLLTALIVLLWLVAAQWFVFFFPLAADEAICPNVAICVQNPLDLLGTAAGRWMALAAMLSFYILLTGRNAEQVNRSSLHFFYRSRLARAYISLGNSPDHDTDEGSRRFEASPLNRADRSNTEEVGKVGEFRLGDDVALRDYRPYDHGGPIHLINCCINQTVDDRTGNFNADRKGVNLTVSSLGVEIGTRAPYDDGILGNTSLAQWVAISGGAVAPGMGSESRFGLSALSFLTGVRLGFWWSRDSGVYGRPWLSKYSATLREWFGKFPGLSASPLFLSDGGHFDNTGIYALLKRRPEIIIAADCGADPDYLFGDVENLIRKARIDYNAKIEFIHPGSLRGVADLKDYLPHFGTPDSITAEAKRTFLLAARVEYETGEVGAIIFVKPRRVRRLPLDLAGYSDRDTKFPQQTTGDQFFDEAQWESYCELGKRLGLHITKRLVDLAPKILAGEIAETRNLASEVVAVDESESGSRRERFSIPVGKTIGAGAAVSLLVIGWQVWQDSRSAWAQARDGESGALSGLIQDGRLKLDAQSAGVNVPVDRALSDWIGSLDRIEVKHGGGARTKAHDQIISTVYQACRAEPKTINAARSNSQQEFCAISLAVLASSRKSAWDLTHRQYWSPVSLNAPAKTSAQKACSRIDGLRRKLVIHTTDNNLQTGKFSSAAVEAGLDVDIQIRGSGDSLADRALDFVEFGGPMLLAGLEDEACVKELRNLLPNILGDLDDEVVPGFDSTQGVLQLWLPRPGAKPIASMHPPGLKTYQIHIKWEGTPRKEIDGLRDQLMLGNQEGLTFMALDRPEREGLARRNEVIYFAAADQAPAKELAERTAKIYAERKCPLSSEISVSSSADVAVPGTLRLNLSPPRCSALSQSSTR